MSCLNRHRGWLASTIKSAPSPPAHSNSTTAAVARRCAKLHTADVHGLYRELRFHAADETVKQRARPTEQANLKRVSGNGFRLQEGKSGL
jgi:hypothetical protein